MTNPHPLSEYRTVRQWFGSFQKFWRSGPPPPEWLDTMEKFVAFCETTPDDIIEEVLKPQPRGEGLMLRTRARRKYIQLIDDFEAAEGSRDIANVVRSFMIHNGVAMSPGILE